LRKGRNQLTEIKRELECRYRGSKKKKGAVGCPSRKKNVQRGRVGSHDGVLGVRSKRKGGKRSDFHESKA